ncbi:MAG: hypothetical protein FWE80_03510, partial [Oscillospiraceae bacterium]|nr:hypothetical protein [Oscillospiraceae bacterium]
AVDYSAEFVSRWCYNRLNSRLRGCYAALYSAVRECREDENVSITDTDAEGPSGNYLGVRVDLPHALSTGEELKMLFLAFTTDNPQFFYIGNTYSYEGYRESDGLEYYNIFCLVFTMNFPEREAAAGRLDAILAEAREGLPAGDQFERELWLHDWLAARCRYDGDTAGGEAPYRLRPAAFTAYGALVDGSAVCEGYSRAMQLLLHDAGIPCTLVNGYRTGAEAHMWNMVTIDGRSYHLDSTWNDPDSGQINHAYFNLTTELIRRSHTIDAENIGVGTATAGDADYYRRSGLYLDTFDETEIAAIIAGHLNAGTSFVELRFAPDKYASAQLLINNAQRFAGFLNPLLEDGRTLQKYEYQFKTDCDVIFLNFITPEAD